MIYSTLFFAGFVNSAGNNLSFTVPAGKVAVLRDLSWGVNPGTVLWVKASGRIVVVAANAGAALISGQWRGDLVVPAGALIQTAWQTGGNGLDITASGFLLTQL